MLTLVNKDTKSEDKYAISSAAIGTGTFSKVYKAVHMENPNMVFAVKIIPLVSESARKQYLQELDIVQHLPKCPNIVHIHKQHLESDNNLYIFQ